MATKRNLSKHIAAIVADVESLLNENKGAIAKNIDDSTDQVGSCSFSVKINDAPGTNKVEVQMTVSQSHKFKKITDIDPPDQEVMTDVVKTAHKESPKAKAKARKTREAAEQKLAGE